MATFTGTNGNDVLPGPGQDNSGDDEFFGFDGNDVLSGGTGADTFDAGSGDDLVYGGIGSDGLSGGADNDVLFGEADNDSLDGGGGDDYLDGGTGADFMQGNFGDDIYVIDNIGDRVFEMADEGVDAVRSRISQTLGDNVENLILVGLTNLNGNGNALANVLDGNGGNNVLNGGAGSDTVHGNAGNDILRGGTGNDLLHGGPGNDLLDGGTGFDVMKGGAGDDVYVVDSFGDSVFEAPDNGTDLVRSFVSHTLDGDVENLTLLGARNLNGAGNGLDNELTGNAGRNRLNGGAGDDTLTGGAGADAFVFFGAFGNDVVTDYQDNFDKFDLDSGLTFASLTRTQVDADSDGALDDVRIAVGGQQFDVLNTARASITATDFQF